MLRTPLCLPLQSRCWKSTDMFLWANLPSKQLLESEMAVFYINRFSGHHLSLITKEIALLRETEIRKIKKCHNCVCVDLFVPPGLTLAPSSQALLIQRQTVHNWITFADRYMRCLFNRLLFDSRLFRTKFLPFCCFPTILQTNSHIHLIKTSIRNVLVEK